MNGFNTILVTKLIIFNYYSYYLFEAADGATILVAAGLTGTTLILFEISAIGSYIVPSLDPFNILTTVYVVKVTAFFLNYTKFVLFLTYSLINLIFFLDTSSFY